MKILKKFISCLKFTIKSKNRIEYFAKLSNQQTGLQYIETVLRYIMSTRDDVSLNELETLTKQAVLTDEKEEIVMTLAERLTGEGMERGMEIGKREGIQKILATQFSHKLKLESQILSNLFNDLSMEQMENIGTRIFEADNINDVKVWVNDIKGLSK